jgi:hypothetical protein
MENTGKPLAVQAACGSAEITELGLTCSDADACPVFLELSSVAAQGNRLFVAGNLHTASTTIWSVFLKSEDMGKTWMEGAERIRSGALDQVQFVDPESGWVSGHLAQALPRDPFLLKTTDGGKTWRRVPVFSEPLVAAIEAFSFSDRNNGVLILDRSRAGESRARFQRYETATGGDVWGLRETSPAPIPLKRGAPVPAEFRLRADSKLKAYLLERRQGARWNVVTGFSVHAGDCRPDPPPPPPDPPAPPPPPLS